MRKCHILILSVVGALLLISCGADQAMKKGDKFYAVGEYFDAATQYRKAYTHTPSKQRVLSPERPKGHEGG